MIGRWIDAQDDEVLRRLARAKKWIAGKLTDRDGGACLLGHAHADMDADTFMLAVHYDALCLRFGDARIGNLISERAGRVLEERKRKVERVVTIYDSVRVPWTDEPQVTRSYVHVSLPTNREPFMGVGA